MTKRAFTLVELLVVISVIALLLAILMPALAKSREQGKAVTCLSNLRQFAIAANLYTLNNDGFYPIAYMKDPDPMDSISITIEWDFINITDLNIGQQRLEPGLLWQGQTIEKIHQCPSFKGIPNSDSPYSGYSYNTSYIGRGPNEAQKIPARVTDVKNSANCVLFGDGEYADGANKFMRSPWRTPYDTFSFRAAGTQGFRHNAKTNISWCDGHASSQKDLFTDTLKNEKARIEQYNITAKNKVGFLSPDNSVYDLK